MWLYNFGLTLYVWLIRLVAPRHPKARLWIDGRKDLYKRMAETIDPTDRIVWVHVASLGEFEQGRPIIERIRKTHPEYKILLTFFSPSGYEVRKNYQGVDYIFYLPIDTPRNARRFLDAAHPEIAIFVKYEFWLNLLRDLRRRKVRTYIVSAIFRRNSIFFRPYGGMWRQALESFDVMFVQNEESKKLLAGLGFDNVIVAGDTRFDRVAEIAAAAKHIDIIDRFKGDKRLFVAGSTWNPDEELLIRLINDNPDVKFIVAPHEMDEGRMARLAAEAKGGTLRYTQCTPHTAYGSKQLLIPRHGGDPGVGLRLRDVELYRRRVRRGDTQHARSGDIRASGGIRPQLREIQGGTRPGDARRRPFGEKLRRTAHVVHPLARQRGFPAENKPYSQRLHHPSPGCHEHHRQDHLPLAVPKEGTIGVHPGKAAEKVARQAGKNHPRQKHFWRG